MSAQDDVLAAFGEPPVRKPTVVAESEADAATGDATAGDVAIGDVAIGEQVAEDRAEAGASEQVEENAAADSAASKTGDASALAKSTAGEQAEETGEASATPEAAASKTSDTDTLAEAAAAEQVPSPSDPGAATEAPASDPSAPAATEPAAATQPSTTPPPTAQPYLDPAAFFAQLQAEAAPKPQRRWPRLALRYGSALVVAGAIGVGTAYAITLPRRTDVPFLATPGDGRYAFLDVVHPVPPVGEPAPGADSNQAQIHYGDLRQYLVPVPVGAVAKEDGWEAVADFKNSLSDADVAGHLYDAGIRHVAWRGWVAKDGQHTVVELLQFPDHQAAYSVASMLDGLSPAKASKPEGVVPEVALPSFGDSASTVAVHTFDQVTGLPGQVERRIVFQSGDLVAIVTGTAPAKVPDTPTEQVALLEAGMLR